MGIKAAFRIWQIKRYLKSVGSLVTKQSIPVRKDLKVGDIDLPPYELNWKGVARVAWQALEDDNTSGLEAYLTTYAPYFTGEKRTSRRDEFVKDEHLEFLNEIHSVALLNMNSATENLRDEFGLSKKQSRTVMYFWLNSTN